VRYVEKAKKIAKKKGIAFTHISTELGKSRGYLSEMLANGRDLPEHMLADVASLLGVTVADLTGNSENGKKPTAQGDGLDVDYIEKWIDNDASEEQLKLFIAKASAKLVKK
jgi:transcriptional regulator with XRE-family HTH domain